MSPATCGTAPAGWSRRGVSSRGFGWVSARRSNFISGMAELTPRTAAWRRAGTFIELDNRRIFVRERARDSTRPPLLFLHGYPSSSYDWRHAFDTLDGHRLIVFDFLGYGLSEKPRGAVYSLRTQADIVEEIARRFGNGRVIVVSHDMGSSVATELLARDVEGTLS